MCQVTHAESNFNGKEIALKFYCCHPGVKSPVILDEEATKCFLERNNRTIAMAIVSAFNSRIRPSFCEVIAVTYEVVIAWKDMQEDVIKSEELFEFVGQKGGRKFIRSLINIEEWLRFVKVKKYCTA